MVRMPNWPMPKFGTDKIDFGREKFRKFLEILGNPENKIPNIIHIAGTNGKGSTAWIIKAILEAAGYSVNLYTSPHLIRFNERIIIKGSEISDVYLNQLTSELSQIEQDANLELTFFEGVTALAFECFSRNKADFTILETGLGGRLDATNVIDNTIQQIITPISYDHMEYLGDSLEKIATEKAGIMRKDRTCIVGLQQEEVTETLQKIANYLSAKLFEFEYDYGLINQDDEIFFISDDYKINISCLKMQGKHQYINAATAIAAIKNLDCKISDQAIEEGLKKARNKGRLEKLSKGVLQDGIGSNTDIWVDGAHNESGMEALAKWIDDNPKKTIVICGFTRGRNCQNLLSHLKNSVDEVVGVTVNFEPSSFNGKYVAEKAREIGFNAIGFNVLEDAIDYIDEKYQENYRIVVTGSLFLVGEAIQKNDKLLI